MKKSFFIWSIIIFMKACYNENKYALLSHFVAFYVFFLTCFLYEMWQMLNIWSKMQQKSTRNLPQSWILRVDDSTVY